MRTRAVSTPSPAETPVTRTRLPLRSTPLSTSSVVESNPKILSKKLLLLEYAARGRNRWDARRPSNSWRRRSRGACPIGAISCPILSIGLAAAYWRSDHLGMQEQLTQLRALAFRYAQGRHVQTAVPRVVIATGREPTGMMTGVCEAMVCVVLQGAKEITIGDKV